jgi:hypothetical protein
MASAMGFVKQGQAHDIVERNERVTTYAAC